MRDRFALLAFAFSTPPSPALARQMVYVDKIVEREVGDDDDYDY